MRLILTLRALLAHNEEAAADPAEQRRELFRSLAGATVPRAGLLAHLKKLPAGKLLRLDYNGAPSRIDIL